MTDAEKLVALLEQIAREGFQEESDLANDALRLARATLARLEKYEAALREVFEVPIGLEGKTAETMAMYGISPMKLIGKMRDIAGCALSLAVIWDSSTPHVDTGVSSRAGRP